MTPFTTLTAIAAPLLRDNIDTDAIIPSREMKSTGKTGLAEGLFAPWRYLSPGSREPDPSFVLNQPAYADARIILGGNNFGCGSSREHAPWALEDWGFRVLIAPSFADIFYNNCFKNGMLPIALSEEHVDELFHRASARPSYTLTANLEDRTLSDDHGLSIPFEVEPFRRHCLLNGLDDIDLTLAHAEKIAAYERAHGIVD